MKALNLAINYTTMSNKANDVKDRVPARQTHVKILIEL